MPKDNEKKAYQFNDQETVKNVNSLTLAFAKAVAKNQADKSDNLIVSPYNALTCLSMAAKGADNNTREEMAKTLFGVAAKELDDQVNRLASLNTAVLAANQGQVDLKTANGLWTNKDLAPLNDTFADDLKKIFGAEIRAEDFSDKNVPDKINAWAGKNTNNLIDKIVGELKPDDFAVLASALYFKGQWTEKFDKQATEDRLFFADGRNVSVTPTMHKAYSKDQILYQDGGDYQAVAITYGEKNVEEKKAPTMRLILVRPRDENISARDWLSQQAGATVPAWLGDDTFSNVPVTVELPRLDIKQKHDLIPALKDMGIHDAFTNAADFSPMIAGGSKDIFIGKVSHDTVFKTDEEGSEAAAVTTVTFRAKGMLAPPRKPIDLKFDRSFVFALQDIKTGAVIFIGAVNKPNNDMRPALFDLPDAQKNDKAHPGQQGPKLA
jgi:serpin B